MPCCMALTLACSGDIGLMVPVISMTFIQLFSIDTYRN
jgi:hypothetical protein